MHTWYGGFQDYILPRIVYECNTHNAPLAKCFENRFLFILFITQV